MLKTRGPALALAFLVATIPVGALFANFYPYEKHYDVKSYRRAGHSSGEEVNKLVALFTGGLIIVGIAQAALFFWQLSLIRESLADAKKASDAASKSAEAAVRQAKAAEDTLSKRERPYLFVYGVSYIKKDEEFGSYFIEFSAANHGAMPAVIDEAFFDVVPGAERPPAPGIIGDWHSIIRYGIVGAGEKRDRIILNIRQALVRGETGGIILHTDSIGQENQYPILILISRKAKTSIVE